MGEERILDDRGDQQLGTNVLQYIQRWIRAWLLDKL